MNRLQKFIPLALGALSLSSACAATFTETFVTPPATNGWQTFGHGSLFVWDSTNQNLRVTWDSSQTNSYLHWPLAATLTSHDDFGVSFDLTFDDYAGGVNPNKPGALQAALGFMNLTDATNTNFSRGAGVSTKYGPKNLVEFNFFPPFDMFSPTIAQVVIGTNNSQWLYNHANLLAMTPGQTFHVAMQYTAANRTLTTVVTTNGAQYGSTQFILVPANHDFRCDHFSISSYSELNSRDSLLAHGTVDNIILVTPDPPIVFITGRFSNATWQVQFSSSTQWHYTLERTTNFQSWSSLSVSTPGNGSIVTLQDPAPPVSAAAYRVRAEQP